MKARIQITNWRIPCEEAFFYIIEIKKHWWSRWKYLEDFSSDNHMPLLFRDRKAVERYLKELGFKKVNVIILRNGCYDYRKEI